MSGSESGRLHLSVVYSRPGLSFERQLLLPSPASVAVAIEASGILDVVAELRNAKLDVGIFSRPCRMTDALHDGDRVEIYRPLLLDPKEARRARAAIRRQRKVAAKSGG